MELVSEKQLDDINGTKELFWYLHMWTFVAVKAWDEFKFKNKVSLSYGLCCTWNKDGYYYFKLPL